MQDRSTLSRRTVLRAGAASTLAASPLAWGADPWPTRPLRMVVGYAPGGTSDSVARLVADKLAVRLGQGVVVENKPGAGGMVGADAVAKAAPDGYTLALASIGVALYPYIYPKVPYDISKDLVPVAQVCSAPNFMAVSVNSPIRNVREFIATAKAQPGKLTFGTPGTGSTPYLSAEVFKKMAGVDMVHVPYKGSAPATVDLAAGTISVMFDNATLGLIRAGKLRGLAVSTAKRSAAAPDLPTIAESGLPGYDITSWYGVLAPAGTPAPIVQRLNSEINAILQLPDVRERYSLMGVDATIGTPEEFGAYIQKELRDWKVRIVDAGMKVD